MNELASQDKRVKKTCIIIQSIENPSCNVYLYLFYEDRTRACQYQRQRFISPDDALEDAGCMRIYQEQIAGITKERPKLQKMLEQFREGKLLLAVGRRGSQSKEMIRIPY